MVPDTASREFEEYAWKADGVICVDCGQPAHWRWFYPNNDLTNPTPGLSGWEHVDEADHPVRLWRAGSVPQQYGESEPVKPAEVDRAMKVDAAGRNRRVLETPDF